MKYIISNLKCELCIKNLNKELLKNLTKIKTKIHDNCLEIISQSPKNNIENIINNIIKKSNHSHNYSINQENYNNLFKKPISKVNNIHSNYSKITIDTLKEMLISEKLIFIKFFCSFILIIQALFISNTDIKISLFFLSFIIIGFDLLKSAVINMLKGKILNEKFLMLVASCSAFLIGDALEAIAVVFFYELGELLEDLALNNSRKQIKSILKIKPEYANLMNFDGSYEKVHPEKIKVGDIILVKPGEKIPLDGIVIEGESFINTSAITGEFLPKNVKYNDVILSGCINQNNALKMNVTEIYKNSTVSKILDLVENSIYNKANIQRFITKFSKIYTPIVFFITILLVIIPYFGFQQDLIKCFYRACIFLVISCPCALIISVPLGIFEGIARASKSGIFVKGGGFLEKMTDVKVIAFDKTGTITTGIPEIVKIKTNNISEKELIKYAAYGEYNSNHPIGKAILNYFNDKIILSDIKDFKEIPGKGINYKLNDKNILIGNYSLMTEYDIKIPENFSDKNIFISIDNQYKGIIEISDKIKKSSISAIKSLKSMGIKTVILSGDSTQNVKEISERVGVDEYYGNLLPQDKVEKINEFIKKENGYVAFVGDGINDAPVLTLSDIGISMGNAGSDSAIEASDVILINDDLRKIPNLIDISNFDKKIVIQNIIFVLIIKLIMLILGSIGLINMWFAIFSDVGVMLIAIINSIRIIKFKK